MNFFKEQEEVRKRLRLFRVLFYLTVLLTAISTAACLYFFHHLRSSSPTPLGAGLFYETNLYWVIFAATLGFILIMCELKMWDIRQGGEYIAKLAGATPLPVHLLDIKHQRLKNIVEEMSIASGIVPPKIFIMQQEVHINAFAAGLSTHDAVIGVSQGCLDKLTREELQGVVAHEIGHIVNGDMRLNLELIGYLFGLMGISEIGRFFMRARDRSRRSKNNAAALGVLLYLVGIVGYYLGLLLKLKISRGQEFGADARAVQFTRNPEGIGGALKKILAVEQEFKVNAPKAHELEHLYLYYPKSMLDLMATHPPLIERIKKILPQFRPSEFKLREEKEFRRQMHSDVSDLITSSFSAPESAAENESELIERARAFFRTIASSEAHSMGPQELMQEMDIVLGRLRSLRQEEVSSLLKEFKQIIAADGLIIPREVLCFTLFKETLLPPKRRPVRRLGLMKTPKEVQTMLSFLALVSSDSEEARAESFKQGAQLIYPRLQLKINSKVTVSEIVKALEVTKELIPLGQARLLEAAKAVIEHKKSENFNKELFLKVLSQVMGAPAL